MYFFESHGASLPGFCRLRLHSKGGSPVAFAEYQDLTCAAQAMSSLQGTYLLSSDRGAIRIEYAKTKMSEVLNIIEITISFMIFLVYFYLYNDSKTLFNRMLYILLNMYD